MNSENSARAESLALFGGLLQLLIAAALAILSLHAPEKIAFQIFAWQNAIGFAIFFANFLHLRAQRLAAVEKLDREITENARHAQGLASMFSTDDTPPAQGNLLHLQRWLIPIAGILIGAALALPAIYWLLRQDNFPRSLFADLPLTVSAIYEIFPLLAAFFLFVIGTYASGLARVSAWKPLRAGAGFALASALWLALFGAMLLLGFKISFYPARIISILTAFWLALQAVEILLSVLFEHYRPRVAGTESRAPYDSRLSGLLAEPDGVFKAFAQTLDYQFGFRVSETWFFRFLERSLAPLLLVMILSLYLMSCFVVVAPGQAAVIERFGAPRGLSKDEIAKVNWDQFAAQHPPLKNGLHFKYPWPIERALIVSQERPTMVEFGHLSENSGEKKSADDGHGHDHESETNSADDENGDGTDVVANWETVHWDNEALYLMPLPDRADRATANTANENSTENSATENSRTLNSPDVMLVAGDIFAEYRIADDAEVYRFLYNYHDSREMLPVIIERELTACLAGEDFWQVLTKQTESGIREKLFDRVNEAIARENLGLTLSSLVIANLHPPAGETGKAFLAVTSSVQQRETEINGGKIEAIRIRGMAPAEAEEIINEAQAYKHRRLTLAKADREWFGNQLSAAAAAAGIFRVEKQMRMLENALSSARKILLPKETTLIMDDSKSTDPDSVSSLVARQIEQANSARK